MVQNLVVPRVHRPVAFESGMQEVVGEVARDIAGLQPDFSAEGVGSHDAVILGTGEVTWFHRQLGGFLNRYTADEVCAKIKEEMPASFDAEIAEVSVSDFVVRMERDRLGAIHNYLVGSVQSWQCTSERKFALNTIASFVGKKGVGLNRDKRFEPKIKIAEVPTCTIPEDFTDELSERIGALTVSLSPGKIKPTAVKNFKRSA